MINGKNVLCIVTARGGSKGLIGKNKKKLLGIPLVGYPIKTAQNSKYIDRVFLSTDDTEISEIGLALGAYVPELRPDNLAFDTTASYDVLNYVLSYEKNKGKNYHILVLLEPTSPLTESSDVDIALEQLLKNYDNYDAIVGISKTEKCHPEFIVRVDEKSAILPFKNLFNSSRRQDLSDAYFLDGSFYISKVDQLLEYKTFYHNRTLGFVTPKWKSLEIDDMIDFVCVEAILKNKGVINDN